MNKKYSLRKNEEIEKLVKKRKTKGTKNFLLYFDKNEETKIAISVSKKLGNAVFRNKQKRQIKDIIRRNIEKIEGIKILIVLKEKGTLLSYQEKEKEILKIVNQIIKEKK